MTKSKTSPQDEPHYIGHRQRLRTRLLQGEGESLHDYELLESLLFAVIPRRDVKPLAKQLLKQAGGLWPLLHADVAQLHAWGLMETSIALLRTVGLINLRAQKNEILDKPLLNNWQRIVDYCRASMAHKKIEEFRLLFLDRKNHLIHEEVQQRGTIDHTPAYPREIVRRALDVGAGALVLCHNHPSGDVAPSKADIEMTREIVAACAPLGVVIHDHIIIGASEVTSFKELALL
ncbi:MAG: DNA repair protein RadC [Bdellovibrionales bacterium]